jgi:hypothetical protein
MSERPPELAEAFWGSWDAKRRLQFVLALEATPEQRLAWLEEMIRIAHASGALPRQRDDSELRSR